MASVVEIRDLFYSYPDGTEALSGINLNIDKDEKVGFVGGNGVGKSTVLCHLAGCLHPRSGLVVIEGKEVSKRNHEWVKRHAGLVFQNPDDQLFTGRIYDDVVFGPVNLRLDPSEIRLRAERVMRDLEIWDLRDKPPYHLSQGQKRFAAIASVLVMEPAILIMDEPTSDLDPRNRRKLIRLVNALPGTHIIASHDLDFIWDTCGRTVILDKGRVVDDGPTREILSSAQLLDSCGLELPLRLQETESPQRRRGQEANGTAKEHYPDASRS